MADVTDVGQAVCVPYDPTIYMGTARYYARGRPPYSRELVSTLTAELALDGSVGSSTSAVVPARSPPSSPRDLPAGCSGIGPAIPKS